MLIEASKDPYIKAFLFFFFNNLYARDLEKNSDSYSLSADVSVNPNNQNLLKIVYSIVLQICRRHKMCLTQV